MARAQHTETDRNNERILVVDDEENMRHMLSVMLHREGYEVVTVPDGKSALDTLETTPLDIILCDIRMPRMDGLSFLKEFRARGLKPGVVMMSAYGTYDQAVEALRLGADDYISKPFKSSEILLVLEKLRERRKKGAATRVESPSNREGNDFSIDDVLAESAPMCAILDTVRKIANYKTTVLISGESGTGKELIAKAIHTSGERAGKPFVAVNCGAIPENLLESELFGYAKGAFTDASHDKAGLFEEAQGGTLFLDEIGELPPSAQAKLLRFLQDRSFERVGGRETLHCDARILCATHRDLEELVESGRLREDLYYRIRVIEIDVPPLRARGDEEILELAQHFLERAARRYERHVPTLSAAVRERLVRHVWPGNVRELEHWMESALVLAHRGVVELSHLPSPRGRRKNTAGLELPLDLTLAEASARYARAVLEAEDDHRARAAERLGIGRNTLARMLKRD